ncbi:MAG: immune inhibitor A, partial [Bacteroidales bacterium]|nr:immune inhibitor A [Bacteroidales bacterium]
MRKYLTLLTFLFCSTIVLAVPADRRPHLVRLVDGTTITAYLHGDEHFSWMQTADGKVLRHLANDVYEFTQRTVEEEIQTAQAYWNEANQMRRAPLRLGNQSTAPLPSVGSPKVPVILVQFQDSVFTVGQTAEEIREYYDKFCNGSRDGKRYQTDYYWGSIYDYFYDQSEGKFRPEFTIIGPVTLSQPQSYYGEWVSNNNKDKRYDEFVRESLEKAVAEYEVDWSEFDNRAKGSVDMAFFIFAGCGENSSGIGSHIWPKEKVSSQTVKLTSGSTVTFSTSGCCCEKNAATDPNTGKILYTVPDGIGVMCHELSHALGLPDFYDT